MILPLSCFLYPRGDSAVLCFGRQAFTRKIPSVAAPRIPLRYGPFFFLHDVLPPAYAVGFRRLARVCPPPPPPTIFLSLLVPHRSSATGAESRISLFPWPSDPRTARLEAADEPHASGHSPFSPMTQSCSVVLPFGVKRNTDVSSCTRECLHLLPKITQASPGPSRCDDPDFPS